MFWYVENYLTLLSESRQHMAIRSLSTLSSPVSTSKLALTYKIYDKNISIVYVYMQAYVYPMFTHSRCFITIHAAGQLVYNKVPVHIVTTHIYTLADDQLFNPTASIYITFDKSPRNASRTRECSY